METFSTHELYQRAGDLIRNAESGHLSIVAKHGLPLFVAVPFDETLLKGAVMLALACRFFQDGLLSLGKAAKWAGLSIEAFIGQLGIRGIPVVNYPPEEIDSEIDILTK